MPCEWPGIDALRLGKFYLLIRRFLHHCFAFLKSNSWDLEISSRLMGVLVESTFFSDDKFQGNGVNYHIASVFLEELRPFLPVRSEILELLLEPFVSVMGRLPDKVLLGKIRSNMFGELLKMGKKLLDIKKVGGEVDSGDDAMVFGTIALTMGFSSKFYELGSSPQCCQGNRKVLFSLHEAFSKLEKDLASSGIEVSLPDIAENDDDEVPILVPIGTEMEVGGLEPAEVAGDAVNASADDKPLSKGRKKKKDSGGSSKKAKKKKKNEISDMVLDSCSTGIEEENVAIANGENSNDEHTGDGSSVDFNESVISNLQMQFEKVAAEAGLDVNVASACDLPQSKVNGTVSKKRKRAKSMDAQQSRNLELNSGGDAQGGTSVKSSKKVRFSMKSNLVWKPHNPLPPQILRLPPSVTPRGSALKKGVPAGPIREMPPAAKKVKQGAVSVKKPRKAIKSISPAIKRLKKLKSRSN